MTVSRNIKSGMHGSRNIKIGVKESYNTSFPKLERKKHIHLMTYLALGQHITIMEENHSTKNHKIIG